MMTVHELSQRLVPRVEDICRELLPAGRRIGPKWKVGDVSGNPGDSMDVELEGPKAGLWKDLASGLGGDLIKLVEKNKNCSMKEACDWARQFLGIENDFKANGNGHAVFDPMTVKYKRDKDDVERLPSKSWAYHNPEGAIIGYVNRYDREGGTKDLIPIRYVDGAWRKKGWKKEEGKPIYNLHRLTQRPDAPVLIVEGEKTCDAAAKHFPHCVCITWQGGSEAVENANWESIVERATAGCQVTLWPDADAPGRKAMTYLKARIPTARRVPTETLPEGWDLADPVPDDISVVGLFDAAGDTAAQKPIADPLVRDYGDPYYVNKTGKVTGINDTYWAALYATENRVLWDRGERIFSVYNKDNGLWEWATPEHIRGAIDARFLKYCRQSGVESLESHKSQLKLKSVTEALKTIVEKDTPFRRKDHFIHVGNGVVRLTDPPTFEGFSPDNFSRNQSPYKYDSNATCPRFLSELINPAVSPGDASLLQRWAGLALFGRNLPQRFLILDGTANGGKGTLVRIIQDLVGIQNTHQLRTDHLLDKFETYRFRNKTLLIGPDVPGDFLTKRGASMLKVLVGGDPISGEGKGLNGDFQMWGEFNVVMTSNSRLRMSIEGDHGAWRRRLLIVRYENPPPAKRIIDFHRTLLQEEGSGILTWAVQGFIQLQKEFLSCGDFILTQPQIARIDSLLSESDSLRLFIRESFEQHDFANVTNSEFQESYAEFCAANGWNAIPVADIERNAPDLMLEYWQVTKSNSIERHSEPDEHGNRRKKSHRGWRGVKVRV